MRTRTTAPADPVEDVAATAVALPLAELRATLEHQQTLLVQDAEFTSRRLAAIHDLLAEIEAASRRMDAGTYGLCRRCGEMIPLPRLSLMPYARFCETCQFADTAVVLTKGAGYRHGDP